MLRPSHSYWLVNMDTLTCVSQAVRIQTRASMGLFNIDLWGGCASRGSRPGHRRRLSHCSVHRLHSFPDCTVNSVVPHFISPAQKIGAGVRVECRSHIATLTHASPHKRPPFSLAGSPCLMLGLTVTSRKYCGCIKVHTFSFGVFLESLTSPCLPAHTAKRGPKFREPLISGWFTRPVRPASTAANNSSSWTTPR
jgi:hypothetical protein